MPTVKRRPKKSREQTTLGHVASAAKRADERRAASGNRWLRIEDGEVATGRIVDVGAAFQDCYVHRVPMTREDDDGNVKTYHADVPCLDQEEKGVPCPGCKDLKKYPRRYKFWCNMIVRDWPDEDGEEKDRIMILSGGITLARKLGKMDAKHGLRNRDIEIEREGTGKKTKYDADWADDENTPLSDADEKLLENRHDIERYTKPPTFDDFFKPPSARDDDDDEDTATTAVKRNVLKRERSDDSDGDGARPRTRTVKKTTAGKTTRSNPLSPGGGKSKTIVRRRAR